MSHPHRVWLGFGANLGDPAARLRSAVADFARDDRFSEVRASRLWRGPYVGPRAPQPEYYNLCLAARTALDPRGVLDCAQQMEREAGRESNSHEEPRVLDIDLLLFDTLVLGEPGLTLPHPRMRQRRFVLQPLAELAPDLTLPPDGVRVADLLGRPEVEAQELSPVVSDGEDPNTLQGSQR